MAKFMGFFPPHLFKRWQVMNSTVVDDRKIIHTELRHFAHALKFALSLN